MATRRRKPRSTLDTRDLPVIIRQHESLAAFVDQARQDRTDRSYDGDSWAGGVTFDQACELATNGWDAKSREVQATLSRVGDVPELAPEWDVAGDEVDVTRFLQGVPESMVSYPYRPARRPVVTIYVNLLYSASVHQDTVVRLGLAIFGGIESLRLSGHTVRLLGVFGNLPTGPPGETSHRLETVVLADTRFAYDPTTVVYAIAHPSMLRLLYFGVQDGWSRAERGAYRVPGGRGRAIELTAYPRIVEALAAQEGYTDDTVWLPEFSSRHNRMSQEELDRMVTELFSE